MLLKPRSHRFFLESKLLRTIRNAGTLHFSIRNGKIVGGGIHETMGLAVARHRLGDHRVHVKSTEERFLSFRQVIKLVTVSSFLHHTCSEDRVWYK
jgi:hypothetical protein